MLRRAGANSGAPDSPTRSVAEGAARIESVFLLLYTDSMTIETTFVLIKPDGVKRAVTGRIIDRFEQCGLAVRDIGMVRADRARAEEHYEEHRGKDFFGPLVDFLTSGPVVILALEGSEAVEVVRKMVGATQPKEALPGTIRGDFCHMGYGRAGETMGTMPNLIHASDSAESARRELALWFGKSEGFADYDRCDADFF
ncbi:MAG: nucleoside-diphosphate kinase [Spirochaetales bacterium]|nr:nucleoside-diphosphate kinase [Spirochaetales bacterium]